MALVSGTIGFREKSIFQLFSCWFVQTWTKGVSLHQNCIFFCWSNMTSKTNYMPNNDHFWAIFRPKNDRKMLKCYFLCIDLILSQVLPDYWEIKLFHWTIKKMRAKKSSWSLKLTPPCSQVITKFSKIIHAWWEFTKLLSFLLLDLCLYPKV